MNDAATGEAIAVDLPAPTLSKGEREYRAFLRLLPQLLTTHHGQFVAVHDERVVDSGPNDIELIRRTHERFGYVPIYVGLVTDERPVIRLPHYREHRVREE